ncbi:hypothetical protein ACN6K9_000125 [Streptomyces sp. SAS_267]|uniref:hypothetical protein n=1 Tax=unclassified Streptomyces TaxID=2593676 RepID=UPI0037014D3B
MSIYWVIFAGVLALVNAVEAIAAITGGWVFPKARPTVKRPRVYGWGLLLFAFGVCLLAVATTVLADPMQPLGRTVAVVAMCVAIKMVRSSRSLEGADRQELGIGIHTEPDPGLFAMPRTASHACG